MVEYISRKFFLTEEEFQSEKLSNQFLVELYEEKNEWHSLNEFGQTTYTNSYAHIFYEYWRSFLVIDQLVETLGSVKAVFKVYQQWASEQSSPLLNWLVENQYLEETYH